MADSGTAMDLLVFWEGDARFGLDAAQVKGILDPQKMGVKEADGRGSYTVASEGTEIQVVAMGAVLGLDGAAGPEGARLILPRSTASGVGFLIGRVEEIVQVEADDIDLFPPLVRPMVKGSGMWGVARSQGESVILIDLVEAAERIAN